MVKMVTYFQQICRMVTAMMKLFRWGSAIQFRLELWKGTKYIVLEVMINAVLQIVMKVVINFKFLLMNWVAKNEESLNGIQSAFQKDIDLGYHTHNRRELPANLLQIKEKLINVTALYFAPEHRIWRWQ